MKKYLKIVLFPLISFLIFSILFSIINMFNIKIISFFYLIISIIVMFVMGYMFGHIIKDKGLTKGGILGIIASLLMFILSLIIGSKPSIYMFVYFIIITISVAFGSMIGINKKEQ